MIKYYELLKTFPFLPKGTVYAFDDQSAYVYLVDSNGDMGEYALRSGLSGYLWLLRTEKGYFRKVAEIKRVLGESQDK